MSQEALQQRAAKIRQNWSRSERRQRAVASDIRCLDLIIRLATGGISRPSHAFVKSAI